MPRIIRRSLFCLALAGSLCAPAVALENRLQDHPSPYLALHAADPVAWQDWNRAAVDLARREQKLVYLSIGYFSCHWCHVMQRESYRDPAIARFLNEHFIPVKVDRELDPALDARMIEFVETTRGLSGWPLNVFVTPEGHALYATLYHPPEEFLTILKRVQQLWRDDRERLLRLAQQGSVKSRGPGKPAVSKVQARAYGGKIVAAALQQADAMHGGFGEQTKFPMVPQLDFLLAWQAQSPNPKLREFLVLSLDRMAHGGLHDHLAGGFFRYTTDPGWTQPHFEKMLYDNALLARLYLRAGRELRRDDYQTVARRTLDFMDQVLRAPDGAFIASLSAVDDQNVEGGYYLWSEQELEALLSPDELAAARPAFGMQDAPPFEAGYLPFPALTAEQVARAAGKEAAQVEMLLTRTRAKLNEARARRVLPRDTKRLAAWNGLALASFAEAARVTGEARYAAGAQRLRDYLAQTLWDGETLRRALADGRPLGKVAVEDYAYAALGLLEWAELSGRTEDYELARTLAWQGWRRFYGTRGWRLEEDSLIEAEAGQDILTDGPMPSPSGVLAAVSLRLADKTRDQDLRRQALAALNSGHSLLKENPFWYATQVGAMLAAGP